MEEIILADPTLNYFINQVEWDINNPMHLEIKVACLKIALSIYLRRYVNQLK
jgi:hypothetical protein